MKKIILFLFLSLLSVAAITAQSDLLSNDSMDNVKEVTETTKEVGETADAAINEVKAGTFPLGEWLDHNYDALWVFQNGNIMLKQNGALVYDFKGEMDDFKAGTDGSGQGQISFRCDGTMRNYIFSMTTDSSDMTMKIKKDSGINYEVVMKKVK